MSEEKVNLQSICESENYEELITYLQRKASNHHCYKFYSKRYRIDSIVDKDAIYLSDGRHWNDNTDKTALEKTLQDHGRKIFVICFSYSISENVAMWMLYSGNDGCMVNFNKEIIKTILQTDTIFLGKFQSGSFVSSRKLQKPEFNIFITDVLYYGNEADNDDGTNYYVKRSDEIVKTVKKSVVDKLTYQKKTLPWMYENECRIIVEIPLENLGDLDADTVSIKFDAKNTLEEKIFTSPNSLSTPTDRKRESNLNYKESKLKGKMNWNLCAGCEREPSETAGTREMAKK